MISTFPEDAKPTRLSWRRRAAQRDARRDAADAAPFAHSSPAATGLGARLEGWTAWLLCALLAWAPLPLASNRPWSKALLVVAIGVVLLLAEIAGRLGGTRPRIPGVIQLAAWLAAGAVAWGWLQGMPGVPLSWQHPFWSEAVTALPGAAAAAAVSLDPDATRTAALLLAAYLGTFWVAFRLGQRRRLALRLANLLVGIAGAYALWGIVRYLGGLPLLLTPGVETSSGITANFPNRNHFATYANIALLTGLVMLVVELAKRSTLNARPVALVVDGLSYLLAERLALTAAVAVLAVASIGSVSRGGLIGLVGGCLCLVAIVGNRSATRLALGLAALLVVGGFALLQLAGAETLERFMALDAETVLADRAAGGRLGAWEVTLRMIGERPWLGHGLGAYAGAFLSVGDARFGAYPYDYAHNTYLEVAAELGLPAAAALIGAVLLVVAYCALGATRGRSLRALPLAAACASVAVGLHALLDFSIQIPAVTLAFAVLLGLGCGRRAAAGGADRQRRSEAGAERNEPSTRSGGDEDG